MFGRVHRFARTLRRFHTPDAAALFLERRRWQRPPGPAGREQPATLHHRGGRPPLCWRKGTSDASVITEVLVDDGYRPILNLTDVRVIVDAGANIGTTCVQLLEAYPQATVIAIEPDPGNAAVLERNVAYYGSRAIVVRAALWSHRTRLAISRDHCRPGASWSYEARPGNGVNEEVESTTVADVLATFKLPGIDILKIDIERGERAVFDDSSREWLERVRVIAIELHDDECHAAFMRATDVVPGDVTCYPNLTVWRRHDNATRGSGS